MEHAFDKESWEQHWLEAAHAASPGPNPHIVQGVAGLAPGTALDAGCGEGAESVWLASQGWRVTGVDISATALERAAQTATTAGVSAGVDWVRADLSTWMPKTRFDLVMTSYAHPAGSQLDLYERIGGWVGPAGVLLVVAHGHGSSTRHGGEAPEHASVTADSVVATLGDGWRFEVAEESSRMAPRPNGGETLLHDVVIRATRGT